LLKACSRPCTNGKNHLSREKANIAYYFESQSKSSLTPLFIKRKQILNDANKGIFRNLKR
jgi:hypothetical protein